MSDGYPFFNFWVKDFLGDNRVQAMNAAEVGGYLLLLLAAWQEDPAATLPADETILCRLARMEVPQWLACRERILACFGASRDGKRLVQKRLRQEYERLASLGERRSKAGKKGAEERWQTHAFAMPLPSQSHTPHVCVGMDLNTPGKELGDVGEEEGFAAFWAAYPRKTAKQAALKAWRKLRPPPEQQTLFLAALARQRQSDQWRRGVIPNAATWLNGARWEDGLPTPSGRQPELPFERRSATEAEMQRRRADAAASRQQSNGHPAPPEDGTHGP